jgi:hypothetical protein
MKILIFVCNDAEQLNIFINKLSNPKKQIINLCYSAYDRLVLFYWSEPC